MTCPVNTKSDNYSHFGNDCWVHAALLVLVSFLWHLCLLYTTRAILPFASLIFLMTTYLRPMNTRTILAAVNCLELLLHVFLTSLVGRWIQIRWGGSGGGRGWSKEQVLQWFFPFLLYSLGSIIGHVVCSVFFCWTMLWENLLIKMSLGSSFSYSKFVCNDTSTMRAIWPRKNFESFINTFVADTHIRFWFQ